MNTLSIKPVAFSLTLFLVITYIICIIFDLVFPGLSMARIWEILLPWFESSSWPGFFIGLIWIFFYGLYASVLYVTLYNIFNREKVNKNH